ncbi:MAG: D-isomer specific 2-hydroxyacid dehydrogenase family protein [Mycobacteriaceae bacterium]
MGPEKLPLLEQAVLDGGGRLVPLEQADALVYWGDDTPQQVSEMAHDGIGWVQLPHAGVEKFVSAGIITRDAVWTSASGTFGPQVAEHALALMLAAARGLHTLARQRTWTAKVTRSFAGSTVVLLGAGGIGRELVRLMEPFGCRVLAVSDSGDFAGAERTVSRADYRDVLPEADYVVVLAPSTPATRGMIGADELAMMKPTAWVVNVARGNLVGTDDLVTALAQGVIDGAALDVTDPEPLPDGHPLWNEPRALITPHAANPDDAYWPTLANRVRENVARMAAGEPLVGVIDPDSGF